MDTPHKQKNLDHTEQSEISEQVEHSQHAIIPEKLEEAVFTSSEKTSHTSRTTYVMQDENEDKIADNSDPISHEEEITKRFLVKVGKVDEKVTQLSKPKKKNKFFRGFLYTFLGLVSFIFFVYITFPYSILKEIIVSQANSAILSADLPLRVSIESLVPNWITGIKIQNLNVVNLMDSKTKMQISEIKFRLALLPLLTGKIRINSQIKLEDGSFELDSRIPITRLTSGLFPVQDLDIKFKVFPLDPVFTQIFSIVKASKNPQIAPFMKDINRVTLGGKLSGEVSLDNTTGMFADTKGKVNINIKNMFFHYADESNMIPRQDFQTAEINLQFENKSLLISDKTKLLAPEIGVSTNGKISIPTNATDPMVAELEVYLMMKGKIFDNLGGVIVPILLGQLRCPQNFDKGEITMKLKGPFSMLQCY